MGPPRKPEPMNPDGEDRFKRSRRDLVGEARESASGAIMGASLLRTHEVFPEAARFLDGMAIGMSRVTDRLKAALDEDEIPF
jgi:hypothetical protein